MAFGLKITRSKFQAMLDTVLNQTCTDGFYAYQDDSVVSAKSFKKNYLGFNISDHKIKPIHSLI